jgi:hypothetical protein
MEQTLLTPLLVTRHNQLKNTCYHCNQGIDNQNHTGCFHGQFQDFFAGEETDNASGCPNQQVPPEMVSCTNNIKDDVNYKGKSQNPNTQQVHSLKSSTGDMMNQSKTKLTEQTLLPVRVSDSNYFLRNKLLNQLTSDDFRVMNTIVNKKEAENDNRKQKSNQGNQAHGPVSQTDVYLRGRGERRRENEISPTGRSGIQESIGSGESHHGACLRQLGLLECADRGVCSCSGCGESESDSCGNRTCGRDSNRNYSECNKGDPKKTGVFLVPNQKGVSEGQIRWFCRDCGKSFITSAVEIPGICPAKHQVK